MKSSESDATTATPSTSGTAANRAQNFLPAKNSYSPKKTQRARNNGKDDAANYLQQIVTTAKV